jgi:nitrate/nitrite-specific signal transduction histidine kinase
LLIGFVAIALIPAVATTAASTSIVYRNGQHQVLDRLESVAALREVQLTSWTQAMQEELLIAVQEVYALGQASLTDDQPEEGKPPEVYDDILRDRLRILADQMQYADQLFLLDLDGRIVLSTDVSMEGKNVSGQDYFVRGLEGSYIDLPFISSRTESGGVQASVPVIDESGEPIGILVSSADTRILHAILDNRTGLGETDSVYLVDQDHALLMSALPGNIAPGYPYDDRGYVYSEGINMVIENRGGVSGILDDYEGTRVVGVYRWLSVLETALVVEQDASEVFGAIYATVLVNGAVALVSVLLAIGASLLITRSIAYPLVCLATTATEITSGDLDRLARVERGDEIGTLAQAFNSMTAQLRELIESLEQRVEARTQALHQRALQLETSAQVSREITAILEIDELLSGVVDLIQQGFGYYSVRIFLVDEESKLLIQQAGSGGAPQLLQPLEIDGNSLNSEAVRSNDHVLVVDVALDPRTADGTESPGAGSELVVPLRVGGHVIGTLDVLSQKTDAFTAADVLATQILCDQTAIAIVNARLYEQSRELAVVQERNRLARELHDSVTQSLYSLGLLSEGWRRLVSAGQLENVEEHLARIGEISQSALKEMRRLIYELRPPVLEQEGLLGALHQRLEAVEGRVGIDARLEVEDLVDMPAYMEEGLYRIALEALNNSLKHASANSVTVRISTDGTQLALEVIDDGVGFDPEPSGHDGRMGITGMRERAAQIGGDLIVIAEPGAGTMIRTTVDCGKWDHQTSQNVKA